MIPVRSIRRLIQEDYYPDEFKCLVCCLLLNRCRGVTVRDVVPTLFASFPDAAAMSAADAMELTRILKPLGFQNQRAKRLVEFSVAYDGPWRDVEELPGIGEYAATFWRMFFLEELGDEAPKDHAVKDYWGIAKGGLWPVEGWEYDPLVEARRWLRKA